MARSACDGCGNAIEQCDCEPEVETVITSVCRQCGRALLPAGYFCSYACGWKWANAALDSKALPE